MLTVRGIGKEIDYSVIALGNRILLIINCTTGC